MFPLTIPIISQKSESKYEVYKLEKQIWLCFMFLNIPQRVRMLI